MIRLLRYGIFLVILSACKGHFHVSEVKPSHYELKSAKNDSIALLNALPYKQKLDSEMKQVIAYSDSALTRDGFESSLGNFVCMAIDHYMNSGQPSLGFSIDPMRSVIIMNRGGLRNNLPGGELTVGNMFEVMPFDNEITVIRITGKQLKECINSMFKEKKLISYKLKIQIKGDTPSKIMFTNLDIDDFNGAYDLSDLYFLKHYFYVITTDYLANGGDNCTFFTDPVPPNYQSTKFKVRDAMIKYCKDVNEKNIHFQPLRFGNIRISK